MKYYGQLIDESVFGYPALKEIISENPNTIYSLLREYLQKHYVEQVKKGLYVAVSMETGAPVASRFEIGSHILENGYISYHSAFEYLGFTNQMMHTVQVSGNGRFRPFSFDGYQCYPERTVLDSVNDLEKAGG